jgi:2-polyprenyl-3-methyl-5-hydroxy-6-metoxy-1,4-benzoquinol methylase
MSYALHYDRWMPDAPDAVRLLARRKLGEYVEYLPPGTDATIVDMGSGPGLLALALAERGYANVASFDADAGQVASARRLGTVVQHVPVERTLDHLRGLEGKVDLFLLIDVLEHVEPDAQVALLAAIRRTLAPRGRLLCQVPNADSPVAMRYRYVDRTHTCAFTLESLAHVLALGGFAVDRIVDAPRLRVSGFGSGPKAWLWYALARSVRASARLRMLPYVGREVAFGVPMSANMLAVAAADAPRMP